MVTAVSLEEYVPGARSPLDLPAGLSEAFVKSVRRWAGRTRREAEIMLHNVEVDYNKRGKELPTLMRLLDDGDFLMILGVDRVFCERTGIPYGRMDRLWEQIRAGAAELYWENCFNGD